MSNNNNQSSIRNPILGGKVFASGGFGCLFEPALKCEKVSSDSESSSSSSKKSSNNKTKKIVSKLMTEKHAISEYDEITKYKKFLERIPSYEDYFLIDGFTLCKPATLTESDLAGFDNKCKALVKKDITSKNINKEHLSTLRSLNMPYGGIDVGEYIKKHKFNYKKMIELNNSLINLLENGIMPMNDIDIFHCDLKESNILVDDLDKSHLYTRLIDWGLSTKYDRPKQEIPDVLMRRPFQYNVPFSSILFNDTFDKMYNTFLKENKGTELTFLKVRSFVIKYVILWIDERGPGHLKVLNNIFKHLFGSDLPKMDVKYYNDMIEFEYTFYFIFEYITKILLTYTIEDKLYLHDYFIDIFLKNIDIWGFTMTYIPMVEYLFEHYTTFNIKEKLIIDKIKECIILLIESSDTAIDTDILIYKLKELNSCFSDAGTNRRHTKNIQSSDTLELEPSILNLNKSKSKSNSKSKTKSKSKSKSSSLSNLNLLSSSLSNSKLLSKVSSNNGVAVRLSDIRPSALRSSTLKQMKQKSTSFTRKIREKEKNS